MQAIPRSLAAVRFCRTRGVPCGHVRRLHDGREAEPIREECRAEPEDIQPPMARLALPYYYVQHGLPFHIVSVFSTGSKGCGELCEKG